MATTPLRIPINNVLMGNDYTGKLYVGSQQKEVNLLLDTGSSTLAVEHKSYNPQHDTKAAVTDLVQYVKYGSGSWVGSVVKTEVKVKAGGHAADLLGVALAVAYHESANMFGKSQGILGLAYAPLDDALTLTRPTVPPTYTFNDIHAGHRTSVEPYFMQLEQAGLVANKFAFYTRRSWIHASDNPASDPFNNGWLILGGGEEATDLYTGPFQTATVLSDDWYSVNLKQIIVGNGAPIPVLPTTHNDPSPTNAIVDSGTNGLDLDPALFDAIVAQLPQSQKALLRSGDTANSNINLSQWPTLTFVLQGHAGDVKLLVKPENYWQLDAIESGRAISSLWRGSDKQSVLGLPLMNGYFTIFDCSANHGLGVVKFAAIK
ncbi:MAG TPA: pepsin-like aspartic protease [Burkholderiales bacterium]